MCVLSRASGSGGTEAASAAERVDSRLHDGTPAISVTGVEKSYGEVKALAGVSLEVASGTVLGLLGPNGAGKTTLVRVLTTLLEPDAGEARVVGFDVVRDAVRLRERIGLAGQYAAVDENLTGLENLTMVGRLYGAHSGTGQGPRRRAAGALRPHRRGRTTGQDVLGRDAAPPRPRRRARGQACGAVSRRADHRPRPA